VSGRIDPAAVAVGDVVGIRTVRVTRADLVHYAGASGDRNPIHWNDRFAREVGLPGVIAHGMFTMGQAVNVVTDWTGDPGAVVEYGVRFSRPVPVPDPGEAVLEVTGVVGAVDAEARTARVDLTVTFEGQKVLAKAQAVVRL
jgi:acyl dehydratase